MAKNFKPVQKQPNRFGEKDVKRLLSEADQHGVAVKGPVRVTKVDLPVIPGSCVAGRRYEFSVNGETITKARAIEILDQE